MSDIEKVKKLREATGAGFKFCWAYIWSKNATPLDKTPAYINSFHSNERFNNEISSKARAGIKANIPPIKHWKVAIVIGKLNILKNLEIKTMWKAQKNALKTAMASPVLTEILSNSVKRNPPKIQINTDGHTDQWVCFEKKK